MRSVAERLSAAALALLVAACAVDASPTPSVTTSPLASPTPSGEPSSGEPSSASASASASQTATADGLALPTPGQPWEAATLLDEMRGSRRPGGVPDQLETQGVAEAVSRTVWTVDGAAWDTTAVGGFCGPSSCTLELAGTHLGRAGEDLWILDVVPSGEVSVSSAEVRSLPWELIDELDALARELDAAEEAELDGMQLSTARWLPPPDEEGRFRLSYRSGGEEGSCAREVTLDAVGREIVESTATGC